MLQKVEDTNTLLVLLAVKIYHSEKHNKMDYREKV